MSDGKIMYVCELCADENPEICGHYDRNELRIMPDGKWVCEPCFDDGSDEDECSDWDSFPRPPEYGPKP